jgi:hypothetical protein
MNVKNFIVGGIVGGIVDFLLGWLIYGMLLKSTFPAPEGATENMAFIFCGCMSFGFMLSFILNQGEGISKCVSGIKVALGVGLLMSLADMFFNNMYKASLDIKMEAINILASLVIATFVGAAIAVINGKMK